MDKFSELKRLAEKCPVQRFEPFIGRAGGRGTQAIFNADTKGEVITWSGFDSSDVTSRTGREAIARFVAAVDPETVLALLAELEAKDKRIAELDRSERQLIEERDVAHDAIDAMYEAATGERPEWSNWFVFADAVEEVAQVRAELEAIRSAAEKLVRCKGRYHSEQNYRALAALFGVTTPDLPPVEGDSEAVIAELRAKLATPVQLTEERTLWAGEDDYDTGHVKGWNANRIEQAALLKKQGFTVEGDS